MSEIFEKEVLVKLSSIEERLSNIEERFDEATSFADSLVDGEGGILGMEGLNTLKDTFSTLLTPQATDGDTDSVGLDSVDPNSLHDLVGSLKDFRERLSGIKDAISDIPDEVIDLANEEQE